MKKIILSLLLCLNLFLLPGCWDRTEINDLAIVTGIALDKKNDKGIELSIEMFIPKTAGGGQAMGGGGRGGEGETLVRTGEGKTIANAVANLQEKLPRRVFWGHSKIIVISEKLAKEGIREPIDFLARHPQPRLRSYVFVSKSKAKDVMALLPPLERSSAEVLRELSVSKVLMDTTLKDLLQMLISDAGTAAIPLIDILPPQKGLSELETIAYVNQTAIFKKDKMIGHIDDSLTRGVLWLRDEIEQATVTIDPKTAKAGYVSVTLIRGRTELLPKIEDGKWKVTVKAITEDDVVLNGTNLNLMNPKLVHMLEKQLEKEVEKRIEATLRKVQKEMKADIFGFAEIFHQKYPKMWANNKDHWEDIFPQVEVKVEVKAYIRRPGMSTTPQGVPEEEVKNK